MTKRADKPDPDNLEEAERQEVYQSIGRFIFHFSQLEFTIRTVLAAELRISGAHFAMVMSVFDFAASCRVAIAAFRQSHRFDEARKKQLVKLLNRALELNDHRVRVAHGVWAVSPTGAGARHVSRQNLVAKDYYEKRGELRELADAAQDVMGCILELMMGRPASKP